MTTFADMMTLLLALFVLLLTYSEVDADKYRAIAQSMRIALGGDGVLPHARSLPPAPPLPERGGDPRPREPGAQEQRAESYAERLRELMKTEIAEQKLTIERRAAEIIVRLQEKTSFPSGSADLEADFSPILAKLAQAAGEIPGAIIITGHTDDRPISGTRFRSNWELSAARAATVVETLISQGGVDPARLEARGMAEHRPLTPNDSDAHRAQNRRVEISFAVSDPVEPAPP